ncbi:DUF4349 domain-containing protein [Nocardioides sp.]|uniref:DUF4349 domain-containing protein n=1 Tax=Nocardioides sp. TaxID=35761 RepID=UPI001A19B11B|nr:DUF4349 domain-containing protein [Nocardioides sp.]MBJ7356681.1 DUF4349 domain-containing protein [Nocardioides sp.]
MTSATRRPALRTILATAATLSVLALTGACGVGSDSDSTDAGDDGGGSVAAEGPAADPAADPAAEPVDPEGAGRDGIQAFDAAADEAAVATAAQAEPEAPAEQDQKLISNGAVQLRSADVGQAIFDVRKVVDTYAGEIEANETQTDDEGDPLRARLQLRVPTARFDAAMQDLERVAVLIASSGNTKDVTTEVLDKDIRVQVQRRSIERISLLLEQATSIRDVVAIEAQLSQRQADLAVLEKEQRYLADQTAMATINVTVERTKEKKKDPPPEKKDDDSGFFAGLAGGWDALTTFGVGLATVLGALLPWLVVAAVLAVPGVPLLRRFRRKEAAPTPAA